MYKRVNELLGTDFRSDEEMNWIDISSGFKLSEEFMKEFKDMIVWPCISLYQILSEDFIRENKDKVCWGYISESQLLSWEFILEFESYVIWNKISLYQPYIDPEYEKIDKSKLVVNELYRLYQETKERGWFFGFMETYNNYSYFKNYSLYLYPTYNKKVRIYWKDLVALSVIKKYELVREVKYV